MGQRTDLDLAVRNALVVDGTGGEPFVGDVGVRAGRIAEVGPEVGPAGTEVDATGLALAPGIIDSHTHYDAQITWDAYATPSVALGVTTVVMGNCGFTIAPCRAPDREQTLKNLTQVEGMALEALLAGTRWEFETFGEYMDMLERIGVVPNVACYCGHSSVRTWVMGEDAIERTATSREAAQMRALVGQALEAGALGFATSTFESHNGWGGTPMPSRFADEAELRALVGVLGEQRRGLFMLTKGKQTTVPFLESLAAETGRPVMVAAIQYDHANPTRAFDDMQAIGAANGRGHRMYGQVACTPVSMDFTLTSAYPFEGLRAWKPAIALYGDRRELGALYSDPGFREAFKRELVQPGSLNRFTDQWDKLEILEAAKPDHAKLEHRTVAELAAEAGQHPADWLLDFGLREDFATLFNAQILNADEPRVLELLKDAHANIGLSDAGAHLFLFCDAGFGLHLLGRWTRERRDFTLAEAVHLLTGSQADTYGLRDRGRLLPGHHADLLLFDADTVGRTAKERVADLPAGASRLTTHAIGVHGIWINGRRVADETGILANGERPGHVLREFVA